VAEPAPFDRAAVQAGIDAAGETGRDTGPDTGPLEVADLARPRPTAIVGVVSGLRAHAERRSSGLNRQVDHVVSFVIERRDDAGRALPTVPVEMRGSGFDGALSEGDRVRLPGGFTAGQTQRLQNLTAGTTFETKGPPMSSVIIGIAAFVGVAAVLIAFFVQFLIGPSL
jgi:hypothetical protein